jgi:hypothetical protein
MAARVVGLVSLYIRGCQYIDRPYLQLQYSKEAFFYFIFVVVVLGGGTL